MSRKKRFAGKPVSFKIPSLPKESEDSFLYDPPALHWGWKCKKCGRIHTYPRAERECCRGYCDAYPDHEGIPYYDG